MASVYRVTATWQNFIGAPGYSKFSFLNVTTDTAAVAATASVRTFLATQAPNLPTGATIQVSAEVQQHDEVTGILVGEIVASATPAIITGANAAAYAGGAGAFVGWKTGTIWQGRRVQGRTFLAPLVQVFDTNGTLSPTFLANLQSAADAMISNPSTEFAVWAKVYDKTVQPPVQINGAAFQTLTAVIKDRASGLRSRRE